MAYYQTIGFTTMFMHQHNICVVMCTATFNNFRNNLHDLDKKKTYSSRCSTMEERPKLQISKTYSPHFRFPILSRTNIISSILTFFRFPISLINYFCFLFYFILPIIEFRKRSKQYSMLILKFQLYWRVKSSKLSMKLN